MRTKLIKIWSIGGITGSLTGLLFFLTTFLLSNDNLLTLPEFIIAMISPAAVSIVVGRATHFNVPILMGVAYMTLLVPLLGPMFGGPGPSIKVVVTILILGLAGGIVWSSPVVIWNWIKRK